VVPRARIPFGECSAGGTREDDVLGENRRSFDLLVHCRSIGSGYPWCTSARQAPNIYFPKWLMNRLPRTRKVTHVYDEVTLLPKLRTRVRFPSPAPSILMGRTGTAIVVPIGTDERLDVVLDPTTGALLSGSALIAGQFAPAAQMTYGAISVVQGVGTVSSGQWVCRNRKPTNRSGVEREEVL
jgi:hypothetical protein